MVRMARRASVRRGRRAVVALVAASALVLSGCGQFTGIYDLPLPGGADLGSEPFEMKAQFRDVLDLVPQTHVKVNEVVVGRVERIDVTEEGWNAEVTMLINGDVDLPANSLANIKMSSLLGEKYIDLAPPPEGTAQGALGDGSMIPLARTNRNVEMEEVLGALSMLLNGGGVEQLNTITRELNKVSTGNEAEIKAMLRNAEELMQTLDGQTSNIDRALDGLNRLSATLREEKDVIAGALDDLSPGMEVLIDQREDLVRMLTSMKRLSAVAVDTMNQSKDDLVANLEALRPILKNIADAGSDLPQALELLVSFPFADSAVDAVHGDYFNLFNEIDLDIEAILDQYRRSRGHPEPGLPLVKDIPMGEDELIDPGMIPRLPSFSSDSLPLPLRGSGSSSLSESAAGLLGSMAGGGR